MTINETFNYLTINYNTITVIKKSDTLIVVYATELSLLERLDLMVWLDKACHIWGENWETDYVFAKGFKVHLVY